jgi:hypothetical protein
MFLAVGGARYKRPVSGPAMDSPGVYTYNSSAQLTGNLTLNFEELSNENIIFSLEAPSPRQDGKCFHGAGNEHGTE